MTSRIVTRGKDPAAAGGPFPLVDGALLDVEAARAAAADGLPLAEARRQVNALLMEAAALDAPRLADGRRQRHDAEAMAMAVYGAD